MSVIILIMGLIIAALGVLLKKSVDRMNSDYEAMCAMIDHCHKLEEIIYDRNAEIDGLRYELDNLKEGKKKFE